MKFIEGILLFLVVIFGMALIMGLPVMWIWNYLMPDLFGLPQIHFWQALWLNVLCSVLFKSSSTSN